MYFSLYMTVCNLNMAWCEPKRVAASVLIIQRCSDAVCSVSYSISLPFYLRTAVAQWLRCCATNRQVAVSIPVGVIKSFRSHYGPEVDSASNRNEN